MTKRRGIALLILLMFLLSATAVSASQVFGDVPGTHWAAKDIARMKAKGVLSGVSATTYAPNDPVTREMLVTMLVRALGKQAEAGGAIPEAYTQRDRVSTYAVGSVAYAVREGIISGTLLQSDPKGTIPRHEVAVLVGRAMGLASEAAAKQNATLDYRDASSIPAASRGYVAIMNDKGIMGGSSDGNFLPNAALTRAQIASVLNRVDNQIKALTGNTVKGKVFGYTSSAITIENAEGVIEPLTLASDVMVFKNGMTSVTSLNADDMVEIIKDSAGRVVYIEQGPFTFDAKPLVGEITSIIVGDNLTVITIRAENGTIDTYSLAAGAKITINNQSGTPSQLAVGHGVTAEVTGKVITSLTVSDAHQIINGKIKNINGSGNTFTVTRDGGLGDVVLSVDNSTVIEIGRSEVDLEDLMVEQTVVVIARGLKATKVTAQDMEVTLTGTLVSVSYAPDVTITVFNDASEKEETYRVHEDVDIRRDRTRDLTLRDLYAGDEVDVDLRNNEVIRIYATAVEGRAEGYIKEVRISATPTIVITTSDGNEESYTVASGARIRRDGYSISLSEINYGDWARLEIEGRQATEVTIEARYTSRYLIGTVENIHNAAQVIVISELDTSESRQVFWDGATTVIRNDRFRDVSYLTQRDEVIVVGHYDAGLFWADTIVIVASRD